MPEAAQPRSSYKALVLDQKGDRTVIPSVKNLPESAFPDVSEEGGGGQVLVSVRYSTINYKDALAVTNKGKVVRAPYPFVAGIDLSGTVVRSDSPQWSPGDKVAVTGWGLGELYWGGFAQFAKMRPNWLVSVPDGLSLQQSMTVGTAGFTAMLAVEALEQKGLSPQRAGDRPVLVTGATGGVGSFAVAILSRLGYKVAASTGRTGEETHRYLTELGATEIVGRISSGRPLDTERWAGAVDSVGGETLAALLSFLAENSSVAACGLAGGHAVPATIFPFILRGVSILGVNSVMYPSEKRPAIWNRIAEIVPPDLLARMTYSVIPLSEVPAACEDLMANAYPGRVVVRLD